MNEFHSLNCNTVAIAAVIAVVFTAAAAYDCKMRTTMNRMSTILCAVKQINNIQTTTLLDLASERYMGKRIIHQSVCACVRARLCLCAYMC